MSENRRFRRKNRTKPIQNAHFATPFFFQKTTVFIEKQKSLIDFLKFMCLRKKVSSEMCQKLVSLDLKTALITV